jgi:hypothetical protein
MAIPVLRRTTHDPAIVAIECRCGEILTSSTDEGLAAQLAVHWRRDDWATDQPSAGDLRIAQRWVAAHAFEIDESELGG